MRAHIQMSVMTSKNPNTVETLRNNGVSIEAVAVVADMRCLCRGGRT
jgi:hypothetical protein